MGNVVTILFYSVTFMWICILVVCVIALICNCVACVEGEVVYENGEVRKIVLSQ